MGAEGDLSERTGISLEHVSTERRDPVTLVRFVVSNDLSTPQLVRLESRIDGPVWPPRRGGTTRPEWSDGRWEATIRPGRSRGVGFATPVSVPPDAQPIELVDHRRVTTDEAVRPDAVLADLREWSPTREVL